MNRFFIVLLVLGCTYVLLCCLAYFIQEKLIFFPQKLNNDYRFNFPQRFEEIRIETDDDQILHGLLFKAKNPRGLIFYLHGNAGSLAGWGEVASIFTDLNFDLFMLDYRGYGKSTGSIQNEKQLLQDVQTAYSEMLKLYDEEKVIVLGYSIGTGPAAMLGATNNPKMVILQSPYYSLADVVKQTVPVIPVFLLRYKLETNRYLKECRMPVVLIHGDSDEVIPYSQSLKLKSVFKSSDMLITLPGQTHNGMSSNPDYQKTIKKILDTIDEVTVR